MPHVVVTDDNGKMAWDERVTDADFDSDHFRAQFSERLSWAVADAARSEMPDASPSVGHRGPIRPSVPQGIGWHESARSS